MAEEYQDRFQNIIKSGDAMFAMCLATDVGIFDALLKAAKPLTCKEIASEKQLKERYVQEILGSLTSNKIIDLQQNEDCATEYFLNDAAKENLGGMHKRTLLFNAIMSCYTSVKSCVFKDGPSSVRYSDDLFYALESMNKVAVDDTISMLLSNAPGLKERLEKGISVAEFGSGGGTTVSCMAAKFPNSSFTASDVRPHLVEQMKAKHGHHPNMKFAVLDICALSESIQEKYDFIFQINVIHDLPWPQEALKGLRRYVNEPDGIVIFVDHCGAGTHKANVGDPDAAAYYSLSTFLCVPESYQKEDSVALGACSSRAQLTQFAVNAGFDVDTKVIQNHQALFLCKPLLK